MLGLTRRGVRKICSAVVAIQKYNVCHERLFDTLRLSDASVSGWRLIGLYLYCLLLATLAAALASIMATWPNWLPGLIR